MATDPALLSSVSLPAAPQAPDRNTGAQAEEVRRLAREFEALLMTQMIRDMRKSFLSEEEEGDSRGGPLMDIADAELGRALSKAGGFGLTESLLNAMRRQLEGGDASKQKPTDPRAFAAALAGAESLPIAGSRSSGMSTMPRMPMTSNIMPSALEGMSGMSGVSGMSGIAGMPGMSASAASKLAATLAQPGLSSTALDTMSATTLETLTTAIGKAAGAGELETPLLPGGPVTSGFGWRSDPMTGALRFHSGVDIAMAYGRDVAAAAAGKVVFAGVSGDYGNMVVIDHGEGQQTRYAHLAEPRVREGDAVTTGQIIGKSGSTGRSTGPHLHFEVLSNGRAVDPSLGGGHP